MSAREERGHTGVAGSGGAPVAVVSGTRRRVLDALAAASRPLDAEALARDLGLHVTTARFHLDQLEAAGLVRRRPAAEARRGRPRVLYSPAAALRDEDARGQLVTVLAAALADREQAAAEAEEAGRRWAESLEPPVGPAGRPADGSAGGLAGDPVAELVAVLDRLGFDPEPGEDGVRLLACPFRDAARGNPGVVCSVHRGLIQRTLERAGGPEASLVPFVEPELCVVRLGGGSGAATAPSR